MNVSVTVIALNSQDIISACISSIKSLTKDIVVVVDSRTTDNTVQVAAALGGRVFIRDFNSYSDQKNFANSRTQNNWVLSLDADETASPGLIAAIKNLPCPQLFQAFYIPRKNKIFGKYINYSNWDPNGLIRLFNKQQCSWVGEVHEEVATTDEVGRLYDYIYHDNYRTVEEFISRQDKYSTLRAEELYFRRIPFSYIRCLGEPLLDFGRRLILHAGYLDGLHGLFLSFLMMVYHYSVWIKLWQKYQNISS